MDNWVVHVDLVLPMDLVYTCLALGLPSWGNPIRHGRILSKLRMVTLLGVRWGRVLRNRCGCWVGPVVSSGLPPFCRFFLGASPSLLYFASIAFGIPPLPNGFAALWWLFSTTVSMSSIASSSYLLMKVPPLATSKRYLSCRPNPS